MKRLFTLITGVLLFLFILCQCITFGGKERTINIHPPTPLDNYQVMLTLGRNNFNYKAAQLDGSDVRVVDDEGNMLSFWIENWNPYGISTLWVKVPRAGTEQVIVTCKNSDDIPGSDGTKVFDPVTWEEFKEGWLYSGINPGMVSGWEYPLTEYDYDVENWQPVSIDTDYVEDCEHSRWFVRKEVFIARGKIEFSGNADDDFVWTLIGADELYKNIGGNETDLDGQNPGSYNGIITMEETFGHFIWAGRGQEGKDDEFLTILSIDSGIQFLYTRKIADAVPGEDDILENDKEAEKLTDDKVEDDTLTDDELKDEKATDDITTDEPESEDVVNTGEE